MLPEFLKILAQMERADGSDRVAERLEEVVKDMNLASFTVNDLKNLADEVFDIYMEDRNVTLERGIHYGKTNHPIAR